MISKLFCKLIGSQVSNISQASSGSSEGVGSVLCIILLAVVLIGLIIWFYCACHGWLVAVYPPFAAFPKWAFVVLMFLITSNSSSSSSK